MLFWFSAFIIVGFQAMTKSLLLYLVIFVFSAGSVGPAFANEQTLSPAVGRQLQAAYELQQRGEYEAALEKIDRLIKKRGDKLSPYEMATLLEIRAFVKTQLGEMNEARADFQAALDIDALPDDRRAMIEKFIEQIDNGELSSDSVIESDRPAAPKFRVPPVFPEKCLKRGDDDFEVFVDFKFDIAEDGSVESIQLIDTNDDCFVDAARESLRQWRYDPRLEDGKPVRRIGVTTRFTFLLKS